MPNHSDSIGQRLARRLLKRADEVAPLTTDADRVRAYANPPRPVEFAEEVLGIKLWSRQQEIVNSIASNTRVAVVSGHKTGKSTSLAVLALWFYCSFPAARVVIMAATDRQVNKIIWREIKRLCRAAKIKIPGADQIKVRASSGLADPSDFSEIVGYTAGDPEAAAGTSGGHMLFLVDEASGVDDEIFEAMEGNRAGGGAYMFLISNPTRPDGVFYEAFHSKSQDAIGLGGWKTIRIDSRESPNCTGEWRELGDKPIPGLADPAWIQEKLDEWGEDDPFFKVRIAGLFSVAEERKIFSLDMIVTAQRKWESSSYVPGRLFIGVDPAGDGEGGDESGFCARIGYRVEQIVTRSGLNAAGHIGMIEDLIKQYRRGGEHPVVLIESEGAAGWEVYKTIRDYAEKTKHFDCVRVRTSEKAVRQPGQFGYVRDELWQNAKDWVREGGCFPPHAKLERDLHAPEFTTDIRMRSRVTSKKDLRKMLGRSPDAGDAFVISCWEPKSIRRDPVAADGQAAAQHSYDDGDDNGSLNPYRSGMNPYRSGMNPYRGR
jgi:phage terminase large subunit